MQHVYRQLPLPDGIITITLFSSTQSTQSSTSTSDSASSDASSDLSSQPTSPPSSIETSPPPSSEPSPVPASSDISSLSQPLSSLPQSSSSLPQSSKSISITTSKDEAPSITAPPPVAIIKATNTPTASENITTIVTSVSGQLTTFTSHLPTSLADSPPSVSNFHRTAIIAGTTAGVFALLLLILGAVFMYRKHKLRRFFEDSGKKKEVKALLDGEEFDDDDVVPMRMRSYRDRDSILAGSAPYPRPGSPAPSIMKSRTSEFGSIFREEVWPPPGFVDPISKRSSQVDLSTIVDDVMGLAALGHEQPGPSGSSSSTNYLGLPSSSHERGLADASTTSVHSQLSENSSTPLQLTSSSSMYTDPFQASPGSSSFFYPSLLPSGTSAPIPPDFSSQAATSTSPSVIPSSSSHLSVSGSSSYPNISETAPLPSLGSSVSSQLRSRNTQPKKSSPLAQSLTQDARIWLGRSPHPPLGEPPMDPGTDHR